ncbi:TIGR03435 family protein [Winogradskyella sp. UBA3174]|uniref:TIGR03435 family protein n=1 Tax=Winogradskyella sp. UBA3174 TaxID=1947785 RepID=UPI0025E702B7|nr:TIGR03435 family protein [Winogradskyella sp. UBA3174]|tara:strand:+ start:20043 stop:21254 length:1212 start_codon:yes stop_codon:yes gene_type:complete
MKNIILFLAVILCLFSCEDSVDITIAEIGKSAPDYTFTNILNSDSTAIALKDFKGKTVILEFWATWCGPCIPAMKKLDSLQTKFKDDLEIITVSHEDNPRLERFIKTTGSKLRIVSDSTHNSFFKYKVIPHSIIIDKEGIVRAITSPENITSDVIKTLITDNTIGLPLKDDFYIDPTLKVETIATVENPDYRIILKGYNQEKRGSSRLLSTIDGTINGIEMSNSTIPRLYQTLFDVSSPVRMVYSDGLSEDDFPYDDENKYNFIIEASKAYEDKWRATAIAFLNDQFFVNGRMSAIIKNTFVLTKINDTLKPSTAEKTEYMFMGPILKTKKIKMSRLVAYLENFLPEPVIDQTNLEAEYDISLEWQSEDPKTLHTELAKYGLKLERSDQPLPVEVMEIFNKKG